VTPSNLSRRVLTDRLALVEEMLTAIRALPLETPQRFYADARNRWTAEACLRRALEALLDIGRHILAKHFTIGTTEYKAIARQLQEQDVLTQEGAHLLRVMAGYRNRMVHFYHELTEEEIYEICRDDLQDIERVLAAYRRWIATNTQLNL
jgi:uncharacterized protein YutE (UPF0331/DUF86 family)